MTRQEFKIERSIIQNNDKNNTPLYWKSARIATTANITLSGTQTIDGVAVVAGDRVLVKNQTNAAQNGIYVVSAGAWTRATDFDSSTDIRGSITRISEGVINIGGSFNCVNLETIIVDTTLLVFDCLEYPDLTGESANRTVYLSTTGDDVTGDGSVGAPFFSPHRALKSITKLIGGAGVSPTITLQFASGNYDYSALPVFVLDKILRQQGAGTALVFQATGTLEADLYTTVLAAATFDTLPVYNIATPYAAGDKILYNEVQYKSKVGANTGNNPEDLNSAYWEDVSNIHYKTGAGWVANAYEGKFVYILTMQTGSLPTTKLVPILRNGTDWIETGLQGTAVGDRRIANFDIVTHKTILDFGARKIEFYSGFSTSFVDMEIKTTGVIVGSYPYPTGPVASTAGYSPLFSKCKVTTSYIVADATFSYCYLLLNSPSSTSIVNSLNYSIVKKMLSLNSTTQLQMYGYTINSIIYNSNKCVYGISATRNPDSAYMLGGQIKIINANVAIQIGKYPFNCYALLANNRVLVNLENCDFFIGSSSYAAHVNQVVVLSPNGVSYDFENEPATGRLTLDNVNAATSYYNARTGLNAIAIAPAAYNVILHDTFENTDVDTGTEVIDSFADTACKAVRWDIMISNSAGTATRCCSINATWDAAADTINDSGEYGAVELGDTTDVSLTVTIAANLVTLSAVVLSDNWIVRAQRYPIG